MYRDNMHKYQSLCVSYFGLQTSAQRRAWVINHYQHVSLHSYIQRNLRSPILHLKIPAETPEVVRDTDSVHSFFSTMSISKADLLHSVIFLWSGCDALITDVNLTERPTAVSLLIKERHGSHGDGADGYRLAVGNYGLFCHHITHVLNIPTNNNSHRLMQFINMHS